MKMYIFFSVNELFIFTTEKKSLYIAWTSFRNDLCFTCNWRENIMSLVSAVEGKQGEYRGVIF